MIFPLLLHPQEDIGHLFHYPQFPLVATLHFQHLLLCQMIFLHHHLSEEVEHHFLVMGIHHHPHQEVNQDQDLWVVPHHHSLQEEETCHHYLLHQQRSQPVQLLKEILLVTHHLSHDLGGLPHHHLHPVQDHHKQEKSHLYDLVLFHLLLQGTAEEVLRLHLLLITLLVTEELADHPLLRIGLGQEGSLLPCPLPWTMATRAHLKTVQMNGK